MKLIFIILSNILFFACINNNQAYRSESDNKILGRKISVQNHQYSINGKDTLIPGMMDTSHYKIIVFAKSSDCERCSWRLEEWYLKKKELSLLNKNTSFIFIIQSENRDLTEHYVREALPNVPVIYDPTSNFILENELPKESAYRTLLLDKTNHVRLIGSPIGNDKLWDSYKKEIDDRPQ